MYAHIRGEILWVEDDAVVVMVQREEHEAVDGLRSLHRVESDDQLAHRRAHGGGVSLGRIDSHGRVGPELLLLGG